MHSLTNGGYKSGEEDTLEDLEVLTANSSQQDVEKAIQKYSAALSHYIQILQRGQYTPGKAPIVSFHKAESKP